MMGNLGVGATRERVSDERLLFGVIDNMGVCHIIGHGGALIGFNSLIMNASIVVVRILEPYSARSMVEVRGGWWMVDGAWRRPTDGRLLYS